MKFKMVWHSNIPYMNNELRKLDYQRMTLRNKKNKHLCPRKKEYYRVLCDEYVKAELKSEYEYLPETFYGGPEN